jgi:hypothetical protein
MRNMLLVLAAIAGQMACASNSYEDYIGAGPGKVPGAVVVGCVGGKITAQCLGYADLASKSPMTENTVG